jgi:muramoyltetrapeptide carboxypeptidase
MMKIPPCIKPGSKIRIVSPAGKIDEKYVWPAVEWLQKQDYNVELGGHIFDRHFQFAGTDRQRLEDLQTALDDPETDVILCSRGGYGTVRIIDKLNFDTFNENPKWLVGFSDITILHSCLNNLGVATIHGAMPRYFFEKDGTAAENLKSLVQILSGEKVSYSFKNHENNRPGKAEAELVGGNLSIISSLQGTKYELETDGKILFLEDIDEFLYHTDRMMHQLKLAGKLDNLAGIILGDFTDIKDNESPFGKTIQEVISGAVQEFGYPVAFGFPAGHDKKNLALAFGQTWQLGVSGNQSSLKLL